MLCVTLDRLKVLGPANLSVDLCTYAWLGQASLLVATAELDIDIGLFTLL